MIEETVIKQLPKFTVPLQGNNKLIEGQAGHFEARLEPVNDPTMKVEWFLNGKPLQSGRLFQISLILRSTIHQLSRLGQSSLHYNIPYFSIQHIGIRPILILDMLHWTFSTFSQKILDYTVSKQLIQWVLPPKLLNCMLKVRYIYIYFSITKWAG